MEERKINVSFGRAGNGWGAKVSLSIPNLKKLGVTPDDREVIVIYEDDKITITKSKKEEK